MFESEKIIFLTILLILEETIKEILSQTEQMKMSDKKQNSLILLFIKKVCLHKSLEQCCLLLIVMSKASAHFIHRLLAFLLRLLS